MTSEPAASQDVPIEVEIARTRALEPDFIGLTRAEAVKVAEQLGIELRVIDERTDGLTADLRSRRITVDLRSGVVTSATAG
ncbi:MAG: hypothetical protein ABI140_22210 [Jatrophihabitantaceae bacterium]